MRPTGFLKRVWSYQNRPGAYFCISTRSGHKWKDHFFKGVPKSRQIQGLIDRHENDDVYFCPLPFNAKHRRRELVIGSKLLWADLDNAHPKKISCLPQIAWRTSPDRYSALWILDRFHSPIEIESVNKGLSYASEADKAGWDLAQVLRLPGTNNFKYDPPPTVRLMWFKDNEYNISKIPKFNHPNIDRDKILKKYKTKIKKKTLRLLTEDSAPVGKRSEIIWRLNNELQEQGLDPGEVFILIKNSVWNKFAGRADEDRQLEREIMKAADDVKDKHHKPGRMNGTPILIRLSDIEPEKVRWLWYPYIPQGKVTLIEGDPGIGKSWIASNLASHISTGRRLPLQKKAARGTAIIMTAEDGLEDTLVNRVIAMGGNRDNIFAFDRPFTFDEEGIDFLDKQIQEIKPKIVTIDPLMAYISGTVDTHKANETREVMTRLLQLAETNKTAIVAVRHLTKGNRDKSIYRGQGSMEFIASARSALLVGRDPDDDDQRVVCHIKSNLAPLGQSLLYSLTPVPERPFRWLGATELTPDDIFKAKSEGSGVSRSKKAEEFIKRKLGDVESMSRDRLIAQAEADGITKPEIMSASRAMEKLKKVKEDDGKWIWRLETN